MKDVKHADNETVTNATDVTGTYTLIKKNFFLLKSRKQLRIPL